MRFPNIHEKAFSKLYRPVCDELEKDEKSSSAKALADAAYRVRLDFGETYRLRLRAYCNRNLRLTETVTS